MGSNNDISLKALAKINLGLDVVRRRGDGYHTDTDQSVFSPCKREQSHIQGCKASDG